MSVLQETRRSIKHSNDREYMRQFYLRFHGTTFGELKQQKKGLMFLVWISPHLVAVKSSELYELPVVKEPASLHVSTPYSTAGGPGPSLTDYRGGTSARNSITKTLLLPPSENCYQWIQEHAITGDSWEAALLAQCRDAILDDDPLMTPTAWSIPYDCILAAERAATDETIDQTTGNKRWNEAEENFCQDLLNELSIDFAEEAAVAETSQRLLSLGYQKSPHAIKCRFNKFGRDWRVIDNSRWTELEDETCISLWTDLDGSMRDADRAARVSERMYGTYHYERTPAQVHNHMTYKKRLIRKQATVSGAVVAPPSAAPDVLGPAGPLPALQTIQNHTEPKRKVPRKQAAATGAINASSSAGSDTPDLAGLLTIPQTPQNHASYKQGPSRKQTTATPAIFVFPSDASATPKSTPHTLNSHTPTPLISTRATGWSPDEDDACKALMAQHKGVPVSQSSVEVSKKMKSVYGYERTDKAVTKRWASLRPPAAEEPTHLRKNDWKPAEDDACRALMQAYSHLPLLEKALEASKMMESTYGFKRSERAILRRWTKIRSPAADNTPDGVQALLTETATEVQDNGPTVFSMQTAPLADTASSTSIAALDPVPEQDPDEEDTEGKEEGQERSKIGSRWTSVEELLCQTLKTEVSVSTAFKGKDIDVITEEVAKRLRTHGFVRTGKGIQNHIHRVEKKTRQSNNAKDNKSRARWSPLQIEVCINSVLEHQNIANMMERFSAAANTMRDDGYNCSIAQIKRKWYEHLRAQSAAKTGPLPSARRDLKPGLASVNQSDDDGEAHATQGQDTAAVRLENERLRAEIEALREQQKRNDDN